MWEVALDSQTKTTLPAQCLVRTEERMPTNPWQLVRLSKELGEMPTLKQLCLCLATDAPNPVTDMHDLYISWKFSRGIQSFKCC